MKIFMTGASGYIGGTVAERLIEASHAVSGLARTEAAAAKLRARGIAPVRGELSSHGVVRDAARAADAVINCADASDPFVVAAIVEGLAGSGKAFLHTSGSSVVGDKAAGKLSPKIHHEDTPREPLPEKIQRVAVDRSVLASAGEGVRSVVLCPGLIYGEGRGTNPDSIQVPSLIRQAVKSGVPRYIGPGENVWSTVHIDDVASLSPLLLDVNCEWSVEEAIAIGRRLAPLAPGWFEEPVFPPEDAVGLRAVGEATGIPIAAGENCCFATQFAALFDAGAVQYAQPSVTKVGGVTAFREIASLASRKGVTLAPHSPYFGPGALATLHLIAALAPEARFEYFYLQAEAALFGSLLSPRRGELHVPPAPGLGADPDPEVIRRFHAD